MIFVNLTKHFCCTTFCKSKNKKSNVRSHSQETNLCLKQEPFSQHNSLLNCWLSFLYHSTWLLCFQEENPSYNCLNELQHRINTAGRPNVQILWKQAHTAHWSLNCYLLQNHVHLGEMPLTLCSVCSTSPWMQSGSTGIRPGVCSKRMVPNLATFMVNHNIFTFVWWDTT